MPTTNGLLDQQVQCDGILVKQLTYDKQSRNVQLAWLYSINQETYSEAKKSANASYVGYGMFDGDYNSFDQARSKLAELKTLNLSDLQARELIISGLSDTQVKAWSDCVLQNMSGGQLAVWAAHINTGGAALYIHWKPGVGAATLKNVTVTLKGGKDHKTGNQTVNLGDLQGDKIVLVDRLDTKQDVTGSVEGVTGGGGNFAADIFIPAISTEPGPVVKQESIDVKNHGTATLVLGRNPPYPNDARASIVVTNSAVWNHSDDPQFSFNVSFSDGTKPVALGPFGLAENKPPRVEQYTCQVDIPKGASLEITAATRNHNADCVDLRIDARVVYLP